MHQLAQTPKIRLAGTVMAAMISVSQIAVVTFGSAIEER